MSNRIKSRKELIMSKKIRNNSGNRNFGNWNSGNWNSGMFNTNEPQVRLFNHPCTQTWTELRESGAIPNLSDIQLVEWVQSDSMNDKEKKEHPSCEVSQGYLKQRSYKQAWAEGWPNVPKSEKKKIVNLPNFDPDIFLEITGIDVRQDEIVEIDGNKYRHQDVVDRLKTLSPIE